MVSRYVRSRKVTCASVKGVGTKRLRGARWAAATFAAAVALAGAAQVSARERSAPKEISANEPADSGGGASAHEVRSGWLKAFAAAPIEMGARYDAPDFYGSLVESEAREAMRAGLIARGLSAAEADDPAALIFSVRVEEPKPASKRPPKSRLRLESVETDPTDNIRDPEVRPFLSLGPNERAVAERPMIAVTIYARRGDERVWSGYAGAPLNGASCAAVVRALTAALVARIGENADIPSFSLTLTAPEGPVQNGLSE
ncbi:MAG TPA: hypothetical protein DDZ68_03600 [Parvularcula sp.]|nr:hypothetical protein [Parvularcula sp.]HBS32711.1 hypothetical protein [Parvularcula sp.]